MSAHAKTVVDSKYIHDAVTACIAAEIRNPAAIPEFVEIAKEIGRAVHTLPDGEGTKTIYNRGIRGDMTMAATQMRESLCAKFDKALTALMEAKA